MFTNFIRKKTDTEKVTTITMRDSYLLRPIRDDEFETWARVIATTYGEDRRDAELEIERATIELDRTIAAFDGDVPVAGTAIYSRVMTLPGAALPIAGITWVGVSPTHRRRGIFTSMTRKQLTDLHESGGEPIAMLNAAEATIYGRFGYGIASHAVQLEGEKRFMRFRSDIDTGQGTIRLLKRDEARPLIEQVYATIWTERVGWVERTSRFWDYCLYDEEHVRHGATELRFAIHKEPDGAVTGYALYRYQSEGDGTIQVKELVAATQSAYAALWRFLIDIDLYRQISYEGAMDEPLLSMLFDARAVRSTVVDRLWVRLVDVDRALAARRYAIPLDMVFEVEDSFCPWNNGRFRLQADGDSATCERTRTSADLQLNVAELGAIFLGGTTLAQLAAAGLVKELRSGAVATCSLAFRGEREPFCPTGHAFPAY